VIFLFDSSKADSHRSPPADKPAAVIADAIQRLDSKKHHLNAVGIQFLQIGDEEGAAEALQLLKECPLRVST
jgi:hypothetical protein